MTHQWRIIMKRLLSRRHRRQRFGSLRRGSPSLRQLSTAAHVSGGRKPSSHDQRLKRDALAYLALHSALHRPMSHGYWLAELAPLLLDDHRLWWKRLNLPQNWPDSDPPR